VKVLLDTHVFLWAIMDDPRLAARHKKAYLDPRNEMYLSIASVWEMLIKVGVGKIPLPSPATRYLANQLERNRISVLGVRMPHLIELEGLPPIHRDPFDRMLVAQARSENMPIASADSAISKYPVKVLSV
jgi:PIN domain nuclease of toxin-antitoxin system